MRSSIYNGEPDRDLIERLNRLIERGPFDFHVAQTSPVDQAAEAHRALGRHYLGWLALRIG